MTRKQIERCVGLTVMFCAFSGWGLFLGTIAPKLPIALYGMALAFIIFVAVTVSLVIINSGERTAT